MSPCKPQIGAFLCHCPPFMEMNNRPNVESLVSVLKDTSDWNAIRFFLTSTLLTSDVQLDSVFQTCCPLRSSRFRHTIEQTKERSTQLFAALVFVDDLPVGLSVSSLLDDVSDSNCSELQIHVGPRKTPIAAFGRCTWEALVCHVILDENQIEGKGMSGEPTAFPVSTRVKSTSSILPLYLVRFTVIEASNQLPAVSGSSSSQCSDRTNWTWGSGFRLPLCKVCGVSEATIYCEADDAILCQVCDATEHAVNNITKKHLRVPLNERAVYMQQQREPTYFDHHRGAAVTTSPETAVSDGLLPCHVAYKRVLEATYASQESPYNVLNWGKEQALRLDSTVQEASDLIQRRFDHASESLLQTVTAGIDACVQRSGKTITQTLSEQKAIYNRVQALSYTQHLLVKMRDRVSPKNWLALFAAHMRLSRKLAADAVEETARPRPGSASHDDSPCRVSSTMRLVMQEPTLVHNVAASAEIPMATS